MSKKVYNNLNEIAIQKMELRYKVRECERSLKTDCQERNELIDIFFLGFKGAKWLFNKLR